MPHLNQPPRWRPVVVPTIATLVFLMVWGLPWSTRATSPLARGVEFRVNTYTQDIQERARVAVTGTGDFVIAWQSYGQDGSGYGVYAQRYTADGTPAGGEFRVNTYTTDTQFGASVAIDANGNFVIIWLSDGQDGSNLGVYGQRYAADGTPRGGEFRVNTYTVGVQSGARVAMDADGDFVVVWNSLNQDGSSYGIYAQRYDANGGAIGDEFRVNTYTIGYQISPHVASDANGAFVIVWDSYDQDGSGDGIYAQRYATDGVAIGGEFRVNTYRQSEQSFPDIAMTANGTMTITWSSLDQDGSSYGIFAQRYSANGAALGREFQVNTYTINSQGDSSIAMNANGDIVIVWMSYAQDGSPPGIYAQRYDSNGLSIDGEFQVNTYTTNSQSYPSVALDADGDSVIVWQSFGQDGSNEGIYAQRYGVPLEVGCGQGLHSNDKVPSAAYDQRIYLPWIAGGSNGTVVSTAAPVTVTASRTPSESVSQTAMSTVPPTQMATRTETMAATMTAHTTMTATATVSPTVTATSTGTPIASTTASETAMVTPTETASETATATLTRTATSTASETATATCQPVTVTPTNSRTRTPTDMVTRTPTTEGT